MTPKVRFAPSPTGLLHVGNARTALINWLFAKASGGHFLLRFDDTDPDRSSAAYATAIEEDLRWAGLDWDSLARQSERLAAYQSTFERLQADGRVYPCYETPEELDYKRKRLLARGRPPIYDRAALGVSEAERRRLDAEGRKPHWRFLLEAGTVSWDDLVRGRVELQADRMSDPVVVRADGTFLYMLPSTIDDVDLAVTHVIRGEDHVANAAVQIQMFQALGVEPPVFAHLPLLTDSAGKGLSKRLGSMTVRSLRDDGIEPMTLNGYLARLGTGEPQTPISSLEDLAADFDIARFGRATPKFDTDQIERLNAQLLHASDYDAIAAKLDGMGLVRADRTFWEAIRLNLHRLSDATYWHDVCFGAIVPIVDDPDFIRSAAMLLPAEPWGETTWETWTRLVKEESGRSGKALFQPLRLALTGREHGPELRVLLPLIGRATAERRLASSGPQPAAALAATETTR
ncbi:MAG: glutamate--tRNA ligase [Rhodospirillales bacterium]|nr:glutamate--tRNA ligase [Rhodospirillales bacterium]